MDNRFQHDMAQEGAGMNDPRRLLREASEHVGALHDATTEWRNALAAAGLPARAWTSNAAYFRLISSSLPGISLGAFVTRLDHFVGHQGPTWLEGSQNDLRAFHEEVIALDTIARPLRGAVHQIHKPTLGNRSEPPLSRALSHPRASTALDDIAKQLGHLSALAPLLKPLPPDPWDPDSALAPAALDRENDGPATMPLSPAPTRPLTRLRAALASSFIGDITSRERLSALRGRVAQSLQPLASWWRPLGSRRLIAMVGILLVLATITVALTLARPPQSPATTPPTAATAGTSPRATPTATPRPATTPTPQPTTPPAPKVTLTCVVRFLSATLTITNSGTTPLTWQAKPQSSLSVSPTHGTLASGQSTTVRVTADHRKSPTGTITVTATTSGGVSTSSSVSCR